jgi:hypothetical protein
MLLFLSIPVKVVFLELFDGRVVVACNHATCMTNFANFANFASLSCDLCCCFFPVIKLTNPMRKNPMSKWEKVKFQKLRGGRNVSRNLRRAAFSSQLKAKNGQHPRQGCIFTYQLKY